MKNLRLPLSALLAPCVAALLLPMDGARADLALDTTFDTDGLAVVDIASGADAARDLAVQSDGRLVLAGPSRQVTGPDTIDFVALTRLDGTTGALDGSFGSAGILSFLPGLSATNGGGGDARALVVQPGDQKILVAGTWKASGAASSQVFVARLGPTGALDNSFGTAGVLLLTPAGVTSPVANAMALRSDGSIIIAGSGTASGESVGFITSVTSAGVANPGFTDVVFPNPLAAPAGANFGFNAVAVLAGDGVLAGGGGGDLTLAQFTSTGAPDTAFDGDGKATFNVLNVTTAQGTSPSFDAIAALAVLGDGRILIAGRSGPTSTSTDTNRVLARVTAAGALDTTFGSGGFAPLPDLGSGEVPEGLAVRPSGDIVLVGEGFAPVQVSPNGIAVKPVPGSSTTTVVVDVEVLSDGDVAAAGQRTVSGPNSAFVVVRLDATDLVDGPDTVPEPFGFTAQTGLEPGIAATSNTITIAGLGAPAPISISGGDQYAIGICGEAPFVSVAGTISDGETVCVKANAAQGSETARTALLNIGGATGAFTLVTGDSKPDAFTFVDQPSVAAGTLIVSAPITLTGFSVRTDVAVVGNGSTFSVGCNGTFTATTTRVDPGTQICVRHTSSASPGGTTSTTLRAGVGSGAANLTEDTFTTTTEGDTTPDAFTFVDQVDVAKSTVIRSASVTLTGFTSNSPIKVSGGEYSIGCTNAFTAAAGTIAPNATVCVRHTSSAAGGTQTSTTLTVGEGSGLTGVSDVFTSTTAGVQDTTPDVFSFTDRTGVALASVITSNVITISGYDTAAPVTVTGGTVSVDCGPNGFTATPQPLAPNSRVCVRHTSPAAGGAVTSTVLTVGGVSDTFTSTTLAGDAAPAPFSFTDQAGVDLYKNVTSAPVTITGIDIASPVSVTGGEYSVGCGSTFVSTAGSISNGQTVCVRHRSSINGDSSVDTVLTIGTVSDTFTSTTKVGDQTPDTFTFPGKTGAALSTVTTSDPITVTGVDSPVVVSATGPRSGGFPSQPLFFISVGCTGTFNDASSGQVAQPGDEICVEVVSAATDLTAVAVTVTIGGTTPGTQKSGDFIVTTGDTVPDPFTFTDQVGVPLNGTVYAAPVTITGITGPSKVQISSNGQYQINCTGSFTNVDGLLPPPALPADVATICVRHLAGASPTTLTTTELTVGGVSANFTSTTTAEKSLPGGSALDPWSVLLLAPLAGYRRRRRSALRRD